MMMLCSISKAKKELSSQQGNPSVCCDFHSVIVWFPLCYTLHKYICVCVLSLHSAHFLGFGGWLTPTLSVLYVDIVLHVK